MQMDVVDTEILENKENRIKIVAGVALNYMIRGQHRPWGLLTKAQTISRTNFYDTYPPRSFAERDLLDLLFSETFRFEDRSL